MVLVADAVHHRVAHLHVVVLHVDLGPQHARALGELAGPHAPQQVEVLLHRSVAERALHAGSAVAAALLGDGLAGLFVDVGQPLLDEHLRPGVQRLEVVAGVEHLVWIGKPSQATSSMIPST